MRNFANQDNFTFADEIDLQRYFLWRTVQYGLRLGADYALPSIDIDLEIAAAVYFEKN